MRIVDQIAADSDQLTAWRRDLHAHPETAFEEHRTSDFVAEKLTESGVEIRRGLGGTGVVGTLRRGDGPVIGLRADMDALDVQETNEFEHRSRNPGKMHACGHDGHTVMLLGAARYLAKAGQFRGTVHFIFQPAEELAGGAERMIKDGLFKEFPVDSVYGMHNRPGLPVGKMAIRTGPSMAASDMFEIKVNGKGTHAGWPHLGTDSIVAAAAMVPALQTIVSRMADPNDQAVVSVTQIHGGTAWAVLPEEVILRGTVRTFSETLRTKIESSMRRIVDNVAAAHDTTASLDYRRGYPALVNHAAEAKIAVRVAREFAGDENVDDAPNPSMGAEDFAYMLQAKPGAFVWIGGGAAAPGAGLHGPRYDFNDEILPIGASYWARLVENQLPE